MGAALVSFGLYPIAKLALSQRKPRTARVSATSEERDGLVTQKEKTKVKHQGQNLNMGFVYITWAGEKKEWSTQLLRPGYYGQRRAGGWRIPADDEDLTLETRADAIDAPSDDGESEGEGESGGVSSSDDDV